MLGFCPLASGSKGNCIYFGSPQTKILIDAGLSGKAIIAKLAEIQVDVCDIEAILITHEHTDHIQGLKVLAYNRKIPIFANQETAKGIVEYFHDCPKFKIFTTGETFRFKDLEIHPFSIPHDTLDPVAFTISVDKVKTGFCTDLGSFSPSIVHRLQSCRYLYVEANHQPSMVHACRRPMIYKKRVLSASGHLSNEDCGELLLQLAHADLKHVHLAHLSSECNSPEIALQAVSLKLSEKNVQLDLSVAFQTQLSKPIYF